MSSPVKSEINNEKVAINRKMRRISWLACLVLILMLAVVGLKPGADAFRQAIGVRGLMQASAGLYSNELYNPFVCLRGTGNTVLAKEALHEVSDGYLKGAGLCLAGEQYAALVALKKIGGHSNAEVQYAGGLSGFDPQAGIDTLVGAGLSRDDLSRVLIDLSNQTGVEPYRVLRVMAHQENEQIETWKLWIQISLQLEAKKEWQAALNWLNEGISIAPANVLGSLYLRAGQIYQTLTDPPDYYAALSLYNQAIEKAGWIYTEDEATTHLYRGTIYSNLETEYETYMALQEYETALKLQPNNYWALLYIGDINLYYLKDFNNAEVYYRRALVVNNKSPYAYLYIGNIYQKREDNQTAVYWYRRALEHQPNWQPALDRLKELEGK